MEHRRERGERVEKARGVTHKKRKKKKNIQNQIQKITKLKKVLTENLHLLKPGTYRAEKRQKTMNTGRKIQYTLQQHSDALL